MFEFSPYVRVRTPDFGTQEIEKSGTFLLVAKSRIFSFGIRNTAQGIWNPTHDGNQVSKFYLQSLESSTWNPESTA